MPLDSSVSAPAFLSVEPGNFVVVRKDCLTEKSKENDWWIGQVLHVIGGARNPTENSLFQIANIDTGSIKTVNADLVIKIVC